MLRFTSCVILSGVKSQGDETESKFWRGSGKVAASRSKTDEDVQSTDEEGICERFMTRRLHKQHIVGIGVPCHTLTHIDAY